MVVTASIYGHDVAMMALEIDNEIGILVPRDSKTHKYVLDNHNLILVIDNNTAEHEAYINDNIPDVQKAFELFDKEEQNYFKEFSSELVLVMCSK